MDDYRVDPDRENLPETGVPIRAIIDDRWSTVDVVHLDKPSLKSWLRSRGEKNAWAEDFVFILLGHERGSVEADRGLE